MSVLPDYYRPAGYYSKPARRTLRLTFKVTGGEVRLVSYQRVEMICPPSVGELPEAGRHSGFWMELRDSKDRVLFHRRLHTPFRDSVAIHSPDGKIRREFGAIPESVFEVLMPDVDDAVSIALIGDRPGKAIDQTKVKPREKSIDKKPEGSQELARFELPTGGQRPKQGGAQ